MATATIANLLDRRGFGSWKHAVRIPLTAVEHGYVELPADLIRQDGTLNVYPDVLKLFQPSYRQNQPIIRCTGWVGYIPLNDRYAIDVATRVPVGNLERLLGLAVGYSPKVLSNYNRRFGHAEERPASFFDILTDQLLDAFERIWNLGLLKTYERKERVGSSPVGRILPFESAWRTAKANRPIAVSSAFFRATDFGPNRVLRYAIEKMLVHYASRVLDQSMREKRLRYALHRLDGISMPSATELNVSSIARYIETLPLHHGDYAEALLVAQLLASDVGISIRDPGGVAILPSILIDMAKAFEDYIRRIIASKSAVDASIAVKDGNIGGVEGAMLRLFNPILPGLSNPKVTPDIVIEVDGAVNLVIDAKYKPAPELPDRNDINQVILYGARYGCKKVMILHSERPDGRPLVEKCGQVGDFSVYNAMIKLDAANLDVEESDFVEAILRVCSA